MALINKEILLQCVSYLYDTIEANEYLDRPNPASILLLERYEKLYEVKGWEEIRKHWPKQKMYDEHYGLLRQAIAVLAFNERWDIFSGTRVPVAPEQVAAALEALRPPLSVQVGSTPADGFI